MPFSRFRPFHQSFLYYIWLSECYIKWVISHCSCSYFLATPSGLFGTTRLKSEVPHTEVPLSAALLHPRVWVANAVVSRISWTPTPITSDHWPCWMWLNTEKISETPTVYVWVSETYATETPQSFIRHTCKIHACPFTHHSQKKVIRGYSLAASHIFRT